MKEIVIKGAREHNLKNIDLVLPRDRLIVFTGLSGSGKSTLAFDTLYAEGQRRYVESLSTYARQFLGVMHKPDVDAIEGLSPAISIEQKTTSKNPRSTVGTTTEIYDYLRLLFARVGVPYCPVHNIRIETQSPERIADAIQKREGRDGHGPRAGDPAEEGDVHAAPQGPEPRGLRPRPGQRRDPPDRRGGPARALPEARHRGRDRPGRDRGPLPPRRGRGERAQEGRGARDRPGRRRAPRRPTRP